LLRNCYLIGSSFLSTITIGFSLADVPPENIVAMLDAVNA
jgi:hypothetical protein